MPTTHVVSDTHHILFRQIETLYYRNGKLHQDLPKYIDRNPVYQEFIENWNSRVNPEDTVIHLGDVVSDQSGANDNLRVWEKFVYLNQKLNGTKHLVRGNHDTLCASQYLQVFKSVDVSLRHETVLFTHFPMSTGRFRWFPVRLRPTQRPYQNILMTPKWYDMQQLDTTNIVLNIHGHLHTYGPTDLEDPLPFPRFGVYTTPTPLHTIVNTL